VINDPVLVLGVVVGLAGLLIAFESYTGWKVFKYLPAFVLMYLGCAALNTFGVLGDAEGPRDALKATKDLLLPSMIFVLLLGCDLRRIAKLGPKLLLTFFVTVLSIMAAFFLVFGLFRSLLDGQALDPQSWIPMASLLASWTGGSSNMVAVNDILQGPENLFGFALITDTVVYSFWLMLMFSSVAVAGAFNRWTKADTSRIDEHAARVEHDDTPITRTSLAVLVFGSILVGALSIEAGKLLPKVGDVINGTAWTIIIVSILGLIAAQTPLGKVAGSSEVGSLMLFVVVGQIASGSDFSGITQAPVYLLMGVLIVLVHGAIMVVYAKLAKADLFSLTVASTANVGGMASAPVVAAAYDKRLVPVGVLFALMGQLIGTFAGLGGGAVMRLFG